MSRFAVVFEDPSYELEEDYEDMYDDPVYLEEAFGVVQKPQEDYSPFATSNS